MRSGKSRSTQSRQPRTGIPPGRFEQRHGTANPAEGGLRSVHAHGRREPQRPHGFSRGSRLPENTPGVAGLAQGAVHLRLSCLHPKRRTKEHHLASSGFHGKCDRDRACRHKNGKRAIPPDLRRHGSIQWLKKQKAIRDTEFPDCPWVFFWHTVDCMLGHGGVRTKPGSHVRKFDASWKAAVKRAGHEGLLFHDLRRSAQRKCGKLELTSRSE